MNKSTSLTAEQKAHFVDENERLFVSYKQDLQKSTKRNSSNEFEILVTDKRIYTNTARDNEIQENIIELDTVKYVNYIQTQENKQKSFLIPLGILLIIAGIIILCLASLFPDTGFLLGMILLILGLVLSIIGIVISRPIIINYLIIGVEGNPIKLIVQDLTSDDVKEMQRNIFKAKEHSNLTL